MIKVPAIRISTVGITQAGLLLGDGIENPFQFAEEENRCV